MAYPLPIPEDRPLTQEEQSLVRWLLEHGNPDAADYLPQLARTRVVSRCPCGCASIDFAIGGVVPPAEAGMHVLSDYVWQADDGSHSGVFAFACDGMLAGLEVWSADGTGPVMSLPAVERLLPFAAVQSVESAPAPDPAGR
jgi:hypothetical protein